MSTTITTIENLNTLAAPFLRGGSFVVCNGHQLKVYLPDARYPARRSPFMAVRLIGARNWFRYRLLPRTLGLGGTDEQTLCQLILYYRGLPRLPGRVLKAWQERNEEFRFNLDLLGYDDQKSLLCVLCGHAILRLDWWSLGDVTGPSCWFGECRETRRTKVEEVTAAP